MVSGTELEGQGAVFEPGDFAGGIGKACIDQHGVVRPSFEADPEFRLPDGDGCGCFDEVSEQGPCSGDLHSVSDADCGQVVELAGHEGKLQVGIDAHRDGGGEGVHVEEVHGFGDLVLNDHAACIAVDEFGGGCLHLVGGEQDRAIVSDVGDGDLAEFGREVAGLVAIVLGAAENGVVPVLLSDVGVGIAEHAGLGVAGEKGKEAILALGLLGDVVLFDQSLVAVIRDGVEVGIEGGAGGDTLATDGAVPRVHHRGKFAGADAGAAFGHGVDAGEQGEAGIEDLGHGPGGPTHAPELEGEKGAPDATGRDLVAARHPRPSRAGPAPVPDSCGGAWKKAHPGLARKASQRLRKLPMR